MARYPKAIWVGEQSPGSLMSRYDIFCIHTIVGRAPAHAAHFSPTADGRCFQSRDTRFRSAANLNGNHRIIASENEDTGGPFPIWNGDGRKVPPLTSGQVQVNGELLRWLSETHGIPLQLCPDSRPGSRGLAYHRQGIDGNFVSGGYRFGGRVSGGEVWTSSFGKVCPGDARIAQLPDILAIARGSDTTTPEDEEMAAWLDEDIYRDGREVSARSVLQRMDRFLAAQKTQRAAVAARFTELGEAVSAELAELGNLESERADRLQARIRDLEQTVMDAVNDADAGEGEEQADPAVVEEPVA